MRVKPMRKSTRGNYGQEALTEALRKIQEGSSIKGTSKAFGIPPKTLIVVQQQSKRQSQDSARVEFGHLIQTFLEMRILLLQN